MKETAQLVCRRCGRALYDRRKKTCGYCGEEIPTALQFSDKMKADLEKGKYLDSRGPALPPSDGTDMVGPAM